MPSPRDDYPDYSAQIFVEEGHDSVSDLSSRRHRRNRRSRSRPRKDPAEAYFEQHSSRRPHQPQPLQTNEPDEESGKLIEEYLFDSCLPNTEGNISNHHSTADAADASLLLADSRKRTARMDEKMMMGANTEEEEKEPIYYLATANSPEMQTIDNNNNVLASNKSPSNVLAYILGGLGLCPPDQQSMNQDEQVNYVTTDPNANANNSNAWCAPNKQDMQQPEQRFQTSNNPSFFQGEEKKDDFSHLQETAQFPFNTNQYSSSRPPAADTMVETGAAFCAPPGCKDDDLPKNVEDMTTSPLPPQEDEVPPPIMKKLEQQPKDLEANISVVRQNSLLDSDNGLAEDPTQARLEQIRQKKRVIERSVGVPSQEVLQKRYEQQQQMVLQPQQQQRQTSRYTRKDKAFVGFFVFIFIAAVCLVAIGFFWPQLMPFS